MYWIRSLSLLLKLDGTPSMSKGAETIVAPPFHAVPDVVSPSKSRYMTLVAEGRL
jgi:hypothetical protein